MKTKIPFKFNGKTYNGFVYINDEKKPVNEVKKEALIRWIIRKGEEAFLSMYGGEFTQQEIKIIEQMAKAYEKMPNEYIILNWVSLSDNIARYVFRNRNNETRQADTQKNDYIP